MATVCAKIFKHHQKADGTYNVKIRVFHKCSVKFIETAHFVSDKQLTKKLTIKDPFVASDINRTLDDYRREIGVLKDRLEFFTAEDLKNHLENKDEEIDFIKFCKEHVAWLKEKSRTGTAANHSTVKNALVDYFKKDSCSIMEINLQFLYSFDRFLRSKRTIVRINQLKREVSTVKEGLTDKGIHNVMRDLRTLFNEAKKRYNNDELGLIKIPHYPFAKYQIPKKPGTKKRNHTVEQIRLIRDCAVKPGSRVELAKELYMLSFYLCGINAVDLYNLEIYNGKRLEYNRAKTKGKRSDNAFISIKIPEEAKALLEKYIAQLKLRYYNFKGLDGALSIGSRQLSKLTGIPEITFYWARHSFSTIARNKCRIATEDIALALNHVDEGNKVTDIYIEKDWTIIDEVQAAVISYLNASQGR